MVVSKKRINSFKLKLKTMSKSKLGSKSRKQLNKSRKNGMKKKKLIKMIGGAFPIQNVNELGDITLIVDSGGGIINNISKYPLLVLKILKGNIDTTIKNINDNAEKYIIMAKSENLVPPLKIIKNNENKLYGYTMEKLEGYTDLNTIQITKIEEFIIILKGILNGFKAIKNTGMFPCPEHGGNIMIKKISDTNIQVKIIDLDDIVKCNNQTELDSLKQLEIIFINNNNLPEQVFLKKINNDYKWNTDIDTIDKALCELDKSLCKVKNICTMLKEL